MSQIKVEIVTPVHNRRDETLECLRSVAASDLDGLAVHVVIVDDGSTDGTAEAVTKDFPDVQIVPGDGQLWYTAGANLAIATALKHDPDYVLLINNDLVFEPGCISRLITCAERHPRSIVGALLLNRENPTEVFQVSPKWDTLKGGFRHWFNQTVHTVPDRPWKVEAIVGNCVLFPAAAIRELGLMDANRLPQYGDAEYTPRMRRAGWQLLIDPSARVLSRPNDLNLGFRDRTFASKFEGMFRSRTGPQSLQRYLYANLGGAPNPFLGLVAFFVLLGRLVAGRTYISSWAKTLPEPPLKEMFASEIVQECLLDLSPEENNDG